MKFKKGLFIVFDGPEGSGKTTQAVMLAKYLQDKSYDVVLTREPGGTQIAESIRNIILSPEYKIFPLTELLLYEAARSQHVAEIIKPSLQKNKIVISDRFYYATIVYQGYGRGINVKLIHQLNTIAASGIKPDLTFILDISPEDGLARVRERNMFDRLEQETIKFHKKIRKGYLTLAKKMKDVVLIKCTKKTKEEVHKIIIDVLHKKYKL